MASIDPDLARVETLQRALAQLEETLAPVLALLGGDGDAASAIRGDAAAAASPPQLSPLDRAKASVAVAYATASLYYVMLKLKGHNPAEHEVRTHHSEAKLCRVR